MIHRLRITVLNSYLSNEDKKKNGYVVRILEDQETLHMVNLYTPCISQWQYSNFIKRFLFVTLIRKVDHHHSKSFWSTCYFEIRPSECFSFNKMFPETEKAQKKVTWTMLGRVSGNASSQIWGLVHLFVLHSNMTQSRMSSAHSLTLRTVFKH